VAARPVEARDEPACHRVVGALENYRDCFRRSLGSARRCVALQGGDHSHLAARKLGREPRQSIIISVRETVFDREIAPFCKTELAQALAKSGDYNRGRLARAGVHEADHRLLRVRGARQGCGRAPEKREKISASHWITVRSGRQYAKSADTIPRFSRRGW